MIQIYKKKNTDFSKNGDSPIFPSSAVVNAELNGHGRLNWSTPLMIGKYGNLLRRRR
ncbi:hypothetical protein [Blautia sp.]|uniref:hypothetical protein n=1 Tax=Blautia sp. TaxID=1955243 RepID=UPI0039907020